MLNVPSGVVDKYMCIRVSCVCMCVYTCICKSQNFRVSGPRVLVFTPRTVVKFLNKRVSNTCKISEEEGVRSRGQEEIFTTDRTGTENRLYRLDLTDSVLVPWVNILRGHTYTLSSERRDEGRLREDLTTYGLKVLYKDNELGLRF